VLLAQPADALDRLLLREPQALPDLEVGPLRQGELGLEDIEELAVQEL